MSYIIHFCVYILSPHTLILSSPKHLPIKTLIINFPWDFKWLGTLMLGRIRSEIKAKAITIIFIIPDLFT